MGRAIVIAALAAGAGLLGLSAGASAQVTQPRDAPPVDTEAIRAATDEGDSTVLLHTDRRALFTAALAEGTPVTVGEPLRLSFNPARFHFFDPDTGSRID